MCEQCATVSRTHPDVRVAELVEDLTSVGVARESEAGVEVGRAGGVYVAMGRMAAEGAKMAQMGEAGIVTCGCGACGVCRVAFVSTAAGALATQAVRLGRRARQVFLRSQPEQA